MLRLEALRAAACPGKLFAQWWIGQLDPMEIVLWALSKMANARRAAQQ